ncbi:unnamed protein product [Durusdinium trenchii]|uniref:non-specific serine/threonine protein kinase n=1 Tax=Durusdinium trenchii TaxID=1381693 RepID=A0ABP0RB71_9DINO
MCHVWRGFVLHILRRMATPGDRLVLAPVGTSTWQTEVRDRLRRRLHPEKERPLSAAHATAHPCASGAVPRRAVLKHFPPVDAAVAAFFGQQLLGQHREQWQKERAMEKAMEKLSPHPAIGERLSHVAARADTAAEFRGRRHVAALLAAEPRFVGVAPEAPANQELMLILEHAGDPLEQRWQEERSAIRPRSTCPVERSAIVEQLLEGVELLGLCGVVHADISASNCCIDDAGVVRLVDFGNAVLLEAARQASGKLERLRSRYVHHPRFPCSERYAYPQTLHRLIEKIEQPRNIDVYSACYDCEAFCGNLAATPPEVLRGLLTAGASDVYGVGILYWWLLTGEETPFEIHVDGDRISFPGWRRFYALSPQQQMEELHGRLRAAKPEDTSEAERSARWLCSALAEAPEDRASAAQGLAGEMKRGRTHAGRTQVRPPSGGLFGSGLRFGHLPEFMLGHEIDWAKAPGLSHRLSAAENSQRARMSLGLGDPAQSLWAYRTISSPAVAELCVAPLGGRASDDGTDGGRWMVNGARSNDVAFWVPSTSHPDEVEREVVDRAPGMPPLEEVEEDAASRGRPRVSDLSVGVGGEEKVLPKLPPPMGRLAYSMSADQPLRGVPIREGDLWHLSTEERETARAVDAGSFGAEKVDQVRVFLHVNGFRFFADGQEVGVLTSRRGRRKTWTRNESTQAGMNFSEFKIFKISLFAQGACYYFGLRGSCERDAEEERSRWVLDVSRITRLVTQSLFPPFRITCEPRLVAGGQDPIPCSADLHELTKGRLMAGYLVHYDDCFTASVLYCELHVNRMDVDGGFCRRWQDHARFIFYEDETCAHQLSEMYVTERSICCEKIGINCSCFSVEEHQFSARSLAERKLWLRAISNLKVKLQNGAPPPSEQEVCHYRAAIKESTVGRGCNL